METAWIQVFILTMSECIAPSGKTVCQQQEFQIEFASAEACEVAREQFIALKSQMDNVIVNRGRTRCETSARQQQVYASLEEVMTAVEPAARYDAPEAASKSEDFTEKAHKERLASLDTCEEARGRRPCKIGEIILEPEQAQSPEVWQRSN